MSPHRPGSAECREAFARLSEFLDGELPADLCDGFDAHMDDCPPCQRFLESLRRTIRMVEDAERPVLPRDVARDIAEAYERMRDEREDLG